MNQITQHDEWFLWGATLVTMDSQLRIISDGVITIQRGKITKIESNPNFIPPAHVFHLNAQGCLVMPGLINGHTHVGMSLLRGIANDLPLYDWLNQHIFPLERELGNKDFVSLGSQLASIEMIRGGITLFNDMYYFEEAAAEEVHKIGLRAICGQTHIEISGVEKSSDVIKKFDQFLEHLDSYPLVEGALAPHSIYGLSETLWRELVRYAASKSLILHTHLCETQEEVEKIRRERGLSPVEWFDSIGLFDQKAICAHAVELSSSDIKILGKKQVGVVYNPESNLKLGNRICPVVDLRLEGSRVAFGTDSTASNNNLNLLAEADVGTKLQVLKYGVGQLKAVDAVKMLTIEGAKALHMDALTGSLEIGKSADLIVLEINKPHCVPIFDWYSHLIYSSQQSDVRDTIVAGRILMRDRNLTTVDENSVLQQAKDMGKKVATMSAMLQSSKAN